jgi:DNA-binding LacI/PurR family transcriptional regulator
MILNSHQVLMIAVLAQVSEPTVRRFYGGRRCETSTRLRIERAASELGLPLPSLASGGDPRLGECTVRVEAKG